jgi:hypothetical protein
MKIPHDIEERLERRWFARQLQELQKKQKKVLNESEVTEEKALAEPATHKH